MKAAAALQGMDLNYNQSHRALRAVFSSAWEQDKNSFQLLIPYLKKFDELNPGSSVKYERDADYHIERVFICPGFMKETLRYVRPMMSLDAAHLKSQWKGTLYVASVKTASDKLYPVSCCSVDHEGKRK